MRFFKAIVLMIYLAGCTNSQQSKDLKGSELISIAYYRCPAIINKEKVVYTTEEKLNMIIRDQRHRKLNSINQHFKDRIIKK